MRRRSSFWTQGSIPQALEFKQAKQQKFISAHLGDALFERPKNTEEFTLVYNVGATLTSRTVIYGRADPRVVARMLALPEGALDCPSKSLQSLRNLTFGFDEFLPVRAKVPGQSCGHDAFTGKLKAERRMGGGLRYTRRES